MADDSNESGRRTRAKRIKLKKEDSGFLVGADFDNVSESSRTKDPDELEEARKSRIRDSNKEFARRMTILQTWSNYWKDYTTREGEAYPSQKARDIIKRTKKISCPIESCGKQFTTVGGLKYHYARCNIEKSYKCLVCNPPMQLTTRGELLKHLILNHCDEMPALNEDQKEIANSYLACESRFERSKGTRKVSADTEGPLSGQNLVKQFSELQNCVFKSDNFANRPFKDWQSYAKDWEVLTNEFDRRRYYPPESESVNFRAATQENWMMIKSGESATLSRDKRRAPTIKMLFTGGVNTAAAWLPKPPYDQPLNLTPDLLAIAVNCCSMDHSQSYRDSHEGEGCVQFWTVGNFIKHRDEGDKGNPESEMETNLNYMIGHRYGTVFDMLWCPLGTSWQPQVNTGDVLSRIGLLALACGDGQIRILSVPHTNTLLSRVPKRFSSSTIEATPLFRVKPIASLIAPGVGPSTDSQATACKTICWNIDDNQRLIAAGYANGNVALFDLANLSPILYTDTDNHFVYHPLKSWVAHGAPVTGIAISSKSLNRTLIATGSMDRQMKIWNPMDLISCISTDRAPITKILWDFRYRGLVTATDVAFTSFNNRVSYRYPVADGNHNLTVSAHRSTVWGLANSIVTNALATSDGAGEVFVIPQLLNRSLHKRDRNILSTHSLYTMIPRVLNDVERETHLQFATANTSTHDFSDPSQQELLIKNETIDNNHVSAPLIVDGRSGGNQVNGTENENSILEPDADFSMLERDIANKPTNFLLPIEHRPVNTYSDFKNNFGLEFVHYNSTAITPESKIPESCIRAGDTTNIYCDRPCDYPFSSVNLVSWSPNANTFPYLLSATQMGLCRIDRVQIVEQVYRSCVDTILSSATTSTNNNDKQ